MCRVNGENTRQQIVGFSWFRLLFRINWWPESSQCHNLLSGIFSIYYRPSMPWWRSFKFLKHVWILFCCDFLSCKNKGSAALSLFTLFWCRLGKGRNNEQVAVSALSASWEAKWYPSSTANMMIYELWSSALAGTFRPQNAVLESAIVCYLVIDLIRTRYFFFLPIMHCSFLLPSDAFLSPHWSTVRGDDIV